jgi:oligopeptide transport system substrate-binding protein
MRLLAFLLAFAPLVSAQEKVLRIPIRADGPKTLDPVRGSTQYEAEVCEQVYETLVQYNYLAEPLRLEPLLLEEMPKPEGLVYRFKLKKGVRFRDDPCFPDGKGRELVAKDVFYSWKRMADDDNQPRSWWLFEGAIKGFDEYRNAQNAAKTFDYDAPVEGMRILSDHEFEVELTMPVYRILYVLAMFQTAIVPREAAETYGAAFSGHPVGTGPFLLRRDEDWQRTKSIVLHRNPGYREAFFPDAGGEARHEASGKRIPFADRIEITFFQEDQPMWLEWKARNLDFVTVPAENFTEAYTKRKQTLKKEWEEQGVTSRPIRLLDFIWHCGFNMEDPLVGGYTEEKRALRKAIAYAINVDQINESFYNGINVVYDGMIPPDLDGYPPEGRSPAGARGPDLDKARALLAKAGYPDGKGLPPLEYWSSVGGNQQEQVETVQRDLAKIGVQLKVRLVDFSQLSEATHEKRAQIFAFAWGSDYPDGENNLALFYGPNESPGSNSFNYKNAAYDELYRKILSMAPSPERTEIYAKMRDMVLEDCPFVGSMARTRFYLIRPRLKHCRPSETFWNWFKYLDVEPDAK